MEYVRDEAHASAWRGNFQTSTVSGPVRLLFFPSFPALRDKSSRLPTGKLPQRNNEWSGEQTDGQMCSKLTG